MPSACGDGVLAQSALSRFQPVLGVEIFAVRSAAAAPQSIGVRMQFLDPHAKPRNPRACREKNLADIILSFQNFTTALPKPLMIEAEHARIKRAVSAFKKRGKRRLSARQRHTVLAQ